MTDPTPETVLAEALHGDASRCYADDHRFGVPICTHMAESTLLNSPPLRDALVRGLGVTPDRLTAALWTLAINNAVVIREATSSTEYDFSEAAAAICDALALTPEATDAADR